MPHRCTPLEPPTVGVGLYLSFPAPPNGGLLEARPPHATDSLAGAMPPHPDRLRPLLPIVVPAVLLIILWSFQPSANDTTSNRGAPGWAAPADDDADSERASVTAVVDGDTIEMEFAGRRHRVRLLGIDSPESVHPELPEQCYGKEATEALSRLLPPGTDIVVERDVELHDRYQRLLLYVYRRSDGLFVNHWLVESGLAEAVFYPPNIHFRPEIQQARQQARASGRGLWGHCDGPDQPLR